ncbi:MAG: amino acid ABC transporter substrate-binding protein [Erysipelotrichaceae bacterium]
MKKMMLCCLFAWLVSGCTTAQSTKDLVDIKAQGYLTVGLDDTFAPMGFRDENGNLVGFDIDLANAIGEQLGIPINFQPIDWSTKELELNQGNIDLIWNGYTITDTRKEKVNFSTPYLSNRQVVVVLSDSSVDSLADLGTKVVALQKDSSALEAVMEEEAFVATLKNQEVVQYNTNLECFSDLDAKRSDAIVVDEILARYIMRNKSTVQYRILDENFGTEEYGIGVRKTSPNLLEAINKALEQLEKDGTYQAIYDTWFLES